MRALAFVVVSGCWVGSAQLADQEPVVAPAPPAPLRVARHRPSRTVWEGHYLCAQGQTALRLTIEREGDALEAIFDFGPLDENPGVPHGSYRMRGSMSETDSRVMVSLSPVDWIEHPPHYVMVGLTATSDPERRLLRGGIDHPSCGELELWRVER